MALDASNQNRIKEASVCTRKAEQHLKTSFIKLKFKPDYDSAAIEYERAAVCYRNASEFQLSCDCYLKAAEMHFSNGNIFHSAKNLENAASLYKDLGDNENAAKHMEVAIERYAEAGTLDTAAMALDKAAKLFEKCDPEKAIKFYNKAIEMVLHTDHSRMVDDFLTRLTRVHLSLEHYKEAAENIDTAMEKYIDLREVGRVGQLALAAVLVQLAREDSVAAMKACEKAAKCADFSYSDHARSCQALISSYESGDVETFRQVLQKPELKNLDNEYLRLIKKLMSVELEGGTNCICKGSAYGDHANSVSENEDEDDLK